MVVVFMMMPCDLQKFANSLELYYPPPSNLSDFTYLPTMFFNFNFEFLELCKSFRLVSEKIDSNFPTKVIN